MESGVARPVVHRGDNAAIRLRHVWSWYEQLNERLVSVITGRYDGWRLETRARITCRYALVPERWTGGNGYCYLLQE